MHAKFFDPRTNPHRSIWLLYLLAHLHSQSLTKHIIKTCNSAGMKGCTAQSIGCRCIRLKPIPNTSLHFFPAPGPKQTGHCIQNKDPDLLSRHRAEKANEKPRKTAKSCKTLPFGTYGKEIKITCQKVRNTCTQAQIGRTMHQELRFLLLHSGPGKPHHWKLEYGLSILQLQPSQIEQFVQRMSLQHSVF